MHRCVKGIDIDRLHPGRKGALDIVDRMVPHIYTAGAGNPQPGRRAAENFRIRLVRLLIPRHHRDIHIRAYTGYIQLAVLLYGRAVGDDSQPESTTAQLLQYGHRIGKKRGVLGKAKLKLPVDVLGRRGVVPFPRFKQGGKILQIGDIATVIALQHLLRPLFLLFSRKCRKIFF